MTVVKEVSRSATVSIAPDVPYMAAGTVSAATFSSSSNLEIFSIDFQSEVLELTVAGCTTTSERFNRLSWGKDESGHEEFPLGIIAGGQADGNIGLWNAAKLIK